MPEDLDGWKEFMLNQQARFFADMEAMNARLDALGGRIERLVDVCSSLAGLQETNELQIAENSRQIAEHSRLIGENSRLIGANRDTIAEQFRLLDGVRALGMETDRRLSSLIATLERNASRNGSGPTAQ